MTFSSRKPNRPSGWIADFRYVNNLVDYNNYMAYLKEYHDPLLKFFFNKHKWVESTYVEDWFVMRKLVEWYPDKFKMPEYYDE